MSVSVNYLSSSIRFQTANPEIYADKENGVPVGAVDISFYDSSRNPVLPHLATTTIVTYKVLYPTSIYRMTLFSEADLKPNGLFFWQIGRIEHVSNFDLAFLEPSKRHDFVLPEKTFIESVGAEEEHTMTFIVRGHLVGQMIKYQLTMDSVEYA